MKAKFDPANLTKKDKLTLIYRHTHKDYKGTTAGLRTILVYRAGTVLVSMDDLTDAEIADKLPHAIKKEEERLAREELKAAFERRTPAFREAIKAIAKLTHGDTHYLALFEMWMEYAAKDESTILSEFAYNYRRRYDPNGFVSNDRLEAVLDAFYNRPVAA